MLLHHQYLIRIEIRRGVLVSVVFSAYTMEDDRKAVRDQSRPSSHNAMCFALVCTCFEIAFVKLLIRKLQDFGMRAVILHELDESGKT